MSKPTTALDRLERLLEYDEGEGFRVFADNEAGIDLRAVCAALRAMMQPVRKHTGTVPGRAHTHNDSPDGYIGRVWFQGWRRGRRFCADELRQRARAELAKAEETTDA